MIEIPFQFVHPKLLKKGSRIFYGMSKTIGGFFPSLTLDLRKVGKKMSGEKYLALCMFNNAFLMTVLWLLFILFSPFVGESAVSLLFPFVTVIIIVLFVFFSQLLYPKIIADKYRKSVEKNLVSALKTIRVQLSSGLTLYDALVTVSQQKYGRITDEFKDVVAMINTGRRQEEALEEMASLNSSKLFKRAIWQVINGIKTGADIEAVLDETIRSLTEEQIVQIQQYGAKLTPLTMFYMMIVVIVPTLSMVFLLLLGAFISLSDLGLQLMFSAVLVLVAFIQMMFIGLIRSKRPALLGDE